MWLLMPAAGLLAVICCLNGYIVYRRICDNTANADQQYHHRSLKRQSSDLVHSVKEWTESSTGQVLVAGVVIVVCLYIALDSRMRAHPEVLLPFLVISLCSIGGFLTYRFWPVPKCAKALPMSSFSISSISSNRDISLKETALLSSPDPSGTKAGRSSQTRSLQC